jgi:hypothetical protein
LYKIINTDGDSHDDSFNAFAMPRPGGKGPTLGVVKKYVPVLRIDRSRAVWRITEGG